MPREFLPVSKDDLNRRGWGELDVILVTGDAYVDHPSYGAAVIGRVLESAGFKVGIIAQPDFRCAKDFARLGRPRLFFGVTGGNLDSMVANYTANRKPRSSDEYSPGGGAGLRPDRAVIIYANRIREVFPGATIVLGGIETSLRRLAHYDYWSDKARRSILLDAKADILVYGMGEAQILEIAGRIRKGEAAGKMDGIAGTVVARNDISGLKDLIEIPSFEEVSNDKDKFNQAFKIVYRESDPFRGRTIAQKHGNRFAVQFPPAKPLSSEELDKIYDLDYARNWHPSYDRYGGVPGFETVRFSVISHRGCCGECNFCSLYFHQGRIVQSRSEKSILNEIKALARQKDFRGTITDIGGPTANLYKAGCLLWKKEGVCRDKRCLVPEKCANLKLGYGETIRLWKEAEKVPGVKHIFIGSGVRYDLLVDKYSDEYLEALCSRHISGRLKVAPEHSVDAVLKMMNKPNAKSYEKFVKRFNDFNVKFKKSQFLVNYFLSSHPGSRLQDALELTLYLSERHVAPEQIQDYLPLPMTASGCMYYTGKNPFDGSTLYVAKNLRERKLQRALIQCRNPKNRRYVIEALRRLNRLNETGKLFCKK